MVFGHFLGNHLKYFNETWSEVRQNGPEVVAKDCRSILSTIEAIFRVKDSQNRPNFMNDPNFVCFCFTLYGLFRLCFLISHRFHGKYRWAHLNVYLFWIKIFVYLFVKFGHLKWCMPYSVNCFLIIIINDSSL